MNDGFGALAIRAFAANAALPIAGATVRIRGAEEENSDIAYSLLTDRDGVTERISLPTPPRELSLSSLPSSLPYALYDVEIEAEGYYPKRVGGVTVFSGIATELPVNLIPRDGRAADLPRGNQSVQIPKNTDLE